MEENPVAVQEIEEIHKEDEKDAFLPRPRIPFLVDLSAPILKSPVDSYSDELKVLKPLDLRPARPKPNQPE